MVKCKILKPGILKELKLMEHSRMFQELPYMYSHREREIEKIDESEKLHESGLN